MKMTEGDMKKIQEELDYRKGELGQELRHTLKVAREQGDLSENADYTAAKRANNQNNSRISYLENLLKNASLIKENADPEVIGINSEVTLYIPEDDEEEVYKLVTSIRGDSTKGRISNESPLGKALMGHRTGDTVLVRVNASYSYEALVRGVKRVEDDGSDDIRKY